METKITGRQTKKYRILPLLIFVLVAACVWQPRYVSASSGLDEAKLQNVKAASAASLDPRKTATTVEAINFGAVPDDAKDDTEALQSAINTGKAVHLARGLYLVHGSLTLQAGAVIFGDGMGVTVLRQTGAVQTSAGLMYADSGSAAAQLDGVQIRDLTVDGNVAITGFSQYQHLVSLNGVKNAVIERVKFLGFRGDGLYVGSGITGGDERHNSNVAVKDSVFDGVNNDNRNGISIIDGDGVTISGSDFRNCSRPTMPGAIDIEPNSNLFHVVKNVKVVRNSFANTRGSNGHISLVLSTAYTTPVAGFLIDSNTFQGGIPFSGISIVGDQGYSHNIVLSGNVGKGLSRPFRFVGNKTPAFWRGIVIRGNKFEHSDPPLMGYLATDRVVDVSIDGNIFKAISGAEGVVFRSGSKIVITNNVFDGHGTAALYFGMPGATYSGVSIAKNIFTGMLGEAVTDGGGIVNAASNEFVGNHLNGARHSFKASREDNLK